MKEIFETAEIEMTIFNESDVITTSGTDGKDPFYLDDPVEEN